MAATTFTFQFDTIRPGEKPDTRYRSNIPPERFLECFDKAVNWTIEGTLANEDKPARKRTLYNAYVYGPGLAKRPCKELYRPEIEHRLEELGLLAIDRPRVVALLWADLNASGTGAGYRAYKVRQTTETLPDFERPHVTHYDLVNLFIR